MLRLSIVVNMYNTAKYLPKCMDSLLHQDLPQEEYEIILVDDCSSDNSVELANEYAQKHKNIKVCTHTHNKGLAGGRNTGVEAAEGEYLAFVDPDDYIEKNSLNALLYQMDNERLDILRFNYQKVDENYNFLKGFHDEENFDYSPQIMTGCEFLTKRLNKACFVWTYIYRLDLIKSNNIRFIEGIFLDDTLWLPRVMQVATRVNCNAVKHQYYLQRSNSMVKIRDKVVMPVKISGQFDLIENLKSQRANATDSGVKLWYGKMIAHSVLTLLRLVANGGDKVVTESVSRLQSIDIFPLVIYKAGVKDALRIKIINISPRAYCCLCQLRTK